MTYRLKNPRISAKERGLIKGALRRVFSRSDLRRSAIDASRIEHEDPARPRVKKWSRCPVCNNPTPTYLMEVDHVIPIIPVDSSLEAMSADDLINRIWCDASNLLAICEPCHKIKTKAESANRRLYKKGKIR